MPLSLRLFDMLPYLLWHQSRRATAKRLSDRQAGGSELWVCSPDHLSSLMQGSSAELSGRKKLLAGAGLAAVLLLAVGAAVRPALWALSFAFARWRRVVLLGYWVALLVAALPLMDWVSRARKVPTIIVRKVGPFHNAGTKPLHAVLVEFTHCASHVWDD